ncbi:putative N-acetyltransferase YafP [Sulfitobacter sp. THAF37]|uniref:GNAT family N-acetyltransferase n=1 Tax=Sulfitobacter sp. THAF37 TaxID=2587855 RepID=UPI001267D5EF|nr:GNAT family N-acetyltransferase [Sulfitobacter sp. THAF37]QFT57950.1 putative N-acetyltransferase YafP [Sulfitobacter sp. THAF37]
MQVRARQENGTDDAALGQLMFDAIHRGPSLYSEAERRAWLPAPNSGPDWTERLEAQRVWVALEAHAPAGFISLEGEDYINLAFVAPAAQGRGVFRALYGSVEAAAQGQRRLWTHASLMAQPAFLAVGFHVIRHETVARAGEALRRAEMEKPLT